MKKNLLLLFSFYTFLNLAVAGTEGGGGGDAVILPDGSVVLADVFLDRNQPQPDNMPRRISLNPKLLVHLKIYKDFFAQQLEVSHLLDFNKSDIYKLLTVLAKRDNGIVFYAVKNVDELNTYCASGGKKAYKLPTGAEVTQVACTSGDEVFLVEPIFKKMDILQQAILLIHERMTTLRDQYGGKNYGAIAGVTAGMGELLRLSYLQQKGERTILSDREIGRIGQFYEGIIELEFRNSEISKDSLDWAIHPLGGGFIRHGAEVSGTSFIDVSSYIDEESVIENKSEIVHSVISKSRILNGAHVKNSFLSRSVISESNQIKSSGIVNSSIGKSSVITKSRLEKIKVGDKNVIDDSWLEGVWSLKLGENGKILDSKIYAYGSIGDSFHIANSFIQGQGKNKDQTSSLHFQVGDHFKMRSSEISTFDTVSIILSDNQELMFGIVNDETQNYVPVGVKLHYPEINIPNTKTECQEPMSKISRVKPENFVQNHCLSSWVGVASYYTTFITPKLIEKPGYDMPSSEASFEMKHEVEVFTTKNRPFSYESPNTFKVLRSFSMNFRLVPKSAGNIAGMKPYILNNGILSLAGFKRRFEIYFYPDDSRTNIYYIKYLLDEIRKSGAQVTPFTMGRTGNYSYYMSTIYLNTVE